MNIFQELKERGFIKQLTDEENIEKLLNEKKISMYVGFDPTKPSMHIGHLIPIMILSHLQKAGHKPICIVGGGTAMIGDPSGKDSMRELLTPEKIDENVEGIKKQLSSFINFEEEKALLLNNWDWIKDLNYVDFLRNIGPHFTVNRMLAAECFKVRWEKGLTFLEFNYMLFQAYDFFYLHNNYDCNLEIGGDDQWSNIIAGIELVRRKKGESVYGMTAPLMTNSAGKKMGKTEEGAVWIDKDLTSAYDYYQFWRNSLDNDVVKFMKLYTFMPLDEIAKYEKLEGAELNSAKEVLAYEATKIVHGDDAAREAQEAARKVFTGGGIDGAPEVEIERSNIESMNVTDLAVEVGLFTTKGEAKRMIKQGGLSINNIKIVNFNEPVTDQFIVNNTIPMKKGKKKFIKVVLK
ncbi:MAG: tyrosine--tRNA ligase [Candidatus Cloacimonadota bacterium]|nr:MAG: tyrosine--tRNA ligase [Candidatus Cloacimonadota bacterium]PIE79287.1 MAG: tyrosine--tRNA ligase [Candidatus Delongbacteria bacterium]